MEPGLSDAAALDVEALGSSSLRISLRATGAALADAGVFTPVMAMPRNRLFISSVVTCSAKVFFTGLGTPAVSVMLSSVLRASPRPSLRLSRLSVSAAIVMICSFVPGLSTVPGKVRRIVLASRM